MISNAEYLVDLGDGGVEYLQSQLGYGGLLAKLLRGLRLERGRVLTKAYKKSDLPEDLDEGLDPRVSRLQWEFVIDLMMDFLKEPDHPLVVFEHPFATPDAEWLSIKPVPHVTCGDDVLFLVNSSWTDRNRIELALVSVGAQYELGLLTHNAALSQQTSGTVEPTQLEAAVAQVGGIILRAFDADGYLVWLPDQRKRKQR